MQGMAQRYQHVDIEQVFHGKSASSARTCSFVTIGAPLGPCVTTIPVNFDFTSREAALFSSVGVRTIWVPCTLQSNFEPGFRPSRLRAEAGRTTCPLLE